MSIVIENVSQAFFNATEDLTLKYTDKVPHWYESGRIQIPMYAIIFLLAVVGNSLVILTLVRNRQMRTITNLFLLNLAVSDLLLGVFCMPFTLIGALLRDFVFGKLMCKLIPFLQACTVSVGVWTLVAISIERYYAICHPLKSLRWQTISHAYKLICTIWLGSLAFMTPIAILSQLKPTNKGNHKCREEWPSLDYEKAYNLFLDVFLLVIPLLTLTVMYSLITRTLLRGIENEKSFRNKAVNGTLEVYINFQGTSSARWCSKNSSPDQTSLRNNWSQEASPIRSSKHLIRQMRQTNAERSLMNKKRITKMLFAVVLEFFICWTPLYAINTVVLFEPSIIYNNLGSLGISFFQLLAYTSSCCNPITYCFMSRGFRKSFLNMFRCCRNYQDERSMGQLTASEFNMDTKWTNIYTKPT